MFNEKEYNKQWRFDHPEYMKQYYIENKEKIAEYKKQWRKDNPEYNNKKQKEWKENNPEKAKQIQKRYRKKNCAKRSEYQIKWKNKRYKTDLKFNLNSKISESIRKSLKRNKAGYHWETLVDYTINDLLKHLKKTLPKGYTWQDFIEGKLHIDHIIPKSIFNFTKSNHIDFKRCWALENLQLLPAKENLRKNAKLTKPFQPALQI